jgi:hypothetical protein
MEVSPKIEMEGTVMRFGGSNCVVEKTIWRAPCGHGTSSKGKCEGSSVSSEVSSPGKLSVFSQSPIGTLGKSFFTVLEMLPVLIFNLTSKDSSDITMRAIWGNYK